MYDRFGSAYTSFTYGYGDTDPSGMEIVRPGVRPNPVAAPALEEEVLVRSDRTGWMTHMRKSEAIRRGLYTEAPDAD